MPSIKVTTPVDDWVSLNSLLDVPVGTEVTLQNISIYPVLLQINSSKPDQYSVSGRILYRGWSDKYVVLAGKEEVWIKSKDVREGDIVVTFNLPFIPPEYALLASQYDYAEMTTETTLLHDNILSFNIFFDSTVSDTSISNIFKGTTGSRLYYRGSDGRFRLISDQGNLYTINIPEIYDGEVHKIMLFLNAQGMQVYVDDLFYGSATRNNTDTFSILEIGEVASVFNFTISNVASYPMLTYNTSSVNTSDEIGDNDLTYVNLLPLTEASYREVSNDY